ncbi:meckelin isoform X1 [Petromyzon marinus]|uniref:meckelin isoform X1 n=2 Tax=Petromyzon marinus TaxID=7757 RepID=UPI003F717A80
MAAAMETLVKSVTAAALLLLIAALCPRTAHATVAFELPDINTCDMTSFWNGPELRCTPCGLNAIKAPDGKSCTCGPGYRLKYDTGGSIVCESCGTNIVGQDGRTCIGCPTAFLNSVNRTCKCNNAAILVEREQNGSLLTLASCISCVNGTVPNSQGNMCVRCGDTFFNATTNSCACVNTKGGLCLYPEPISTGVLINSNWFSDNFDAARVACETYQNRTACQVLGNMCVMFMDVGALYVYCANFFLTAPSLKQVHGIQTWFENRPWIYYMSDTAASVLASTDFPVVFSLRGSGESKLRLVLGMYDIRGKFLGYKSAAGGLLQLCPGTLSRLDAAYTFGTAYAQSCTLSRITLQELFPEPIFYDPYLQFTQGGKEYMYALPVLNSNLQRGDRAPNKQSDQAQWMLMRRFFLVDALTDSNTINYASSITISITMPTNNANRTIYPPLITVDFTKFSKTSNDSLKVSFSVVYNMSQADAKLQTEIALGVLGSLAVFYAMMQTTGWRRRAGLQMVEFSSLVKFFLILAGALSNVFFIVTFGTGLYWLIIFKSQQTVAVMLPTPSEERNFIIYLSCAFALKAVQFLHLIATQVSIDIFFFDWERPKGKARQGAEAASARGVSVWRTFFVANEWNELQTVRKLSPMLQLFAVLLFLKVVGFENLGLRDLGVTLLPAPNADEASWSRILRFGVASSVWLVVGAVQVIFNTIIYERFVEDKIRQFVDLCSMSNISILILENRCFGYYIHGRSVHGRADTNMEDMHANLKKEEENLCSQRGLVPGTELQTFEVALTQAARLHYDRILQPLAMMAAPPRMAGPQGGPMEQSMRAYQTMNRFLCSFVDHAHKEVDYMIRDKLLLERLTGIEFQETFDKSFLYNDESHSFSNVLYYGHEATLLLLDMLLFCIIDMGTQDFTLATIITFVVQKLFRSIRESFSRRNLVKKTLVDERFLI